MCFLVFKLCPSFGSLIDARELVLTGQVGFQVLVLLLSLLRASFCCCVVSLGVSGLSCGFFDFGFCSFHFLSKVSFLESLF